MWESPIQISTIAEEIGRKIADEQDNYIVESCVKMGVNVDKDELVKALAYDRHQYEKGYADGRMARDDEITRCKDCVWYRLSSYIAFDKDEEYGRRCANVGCLVKPDFFCGWAERSEDE